MPVFLCYALQWCLVNYAFSNMPFQTLTYPRVLSIAGSDSGGGAGIQADLKTFAALGCFGMTAITAITAQNTLGVKSVQAIAPDILRDQIQAVASDIGVDAVKIGMLHDAPTMRTTAACLQQHGLQPVVLDPVMVATSGAVLMEHSAIGVLVKELFPLACLITPNLPEAALLLGYELHTVQDMRRAAHALQQLGQQCAVLLKGGHLPGPTITDVLLLPCGSEHLFTEPRIASNNTHGTGCTLSSAIAAHLALGADLRQAVQSARAYVRGALLAAASARMGQGAGPLNHGFAPLAMQLR